MKNILIIGGSYFIGKVFALTALKDKGCKMHIMNRGNNPLKVEGISEYKCDRHDTHRLKAAVPPLVFDAVVDFCAYNPSDVDMLLSHLPCQIKHYIYISSCAVFRPSSDHPKYEDSPKIDSLVPGPAGEYAYNKRILETETKKVCERMDIPYTIIRPSFVYGPYNYAPRESFFFKIILSGGELSVPSPCLALFQFVYVKDIAKFLLACIGNQSVINKSYNLSAPELISYEKLIQTLASITDAPIKQKRLDVETIERERIPLPFPLEQHELFSGEAICDALSLAYTPFYDGLKESFEFYKKYVYRP